MVPTQPLTIQRARFGGVFAVNARAIVQPDRDVRHLGTLIGPASLSDLSTLAIVNLMPNLLADEALEFKYHIRVRDTDGIVLFDHFFVMPDAAANLFDLIPVEQDPDSLTETVLTSNDREASQ